MNPDDPGSVGAQWPLIGLAVLLILLILLTPGLVGPSTPAAGSIGSTAFLAVDRPSGNNTTHLYLLGIEYPRYVSLSIAVAPIGWPPSVPAHERNWSVWSNATEALDVSLVTTVNPFLVNVSAWYVDAQGASALYVGEYACLASGSTLVIDAVTPSLQGAAPSSATTFPVLLPLALIPGARP